MRPVLLSLALLVLTAAAARAEEVVVLDNGVVLRGRVVREQEDRMTIQLSGFTTDSRVSVEKRRIVQRYVSIDRARTPAPGPSEAIGAAPALAPVRAPAPRVESLMPVYVAPEWEEVALPVEEPPPAEEPFFERLRRVTPLSLPSSAMGLAIMGLLMFVCLAALVTMGARWLDMGLPSLQATWTLALLYGTFAVGDLALHRELLRADRALWVLLLQAVLWVGLAKALLETPTPRTVMLFAFVVFGSLVFVFVTGALLVSV